MYHTMVVKQRVMALYRKHTPYWWIKGVN